MATIWAEFGTAVTAARQAKVISRATLAAGLFGAAGRMGYVYQIEQGSAVLHSGTVQSLAQMLDLPDGVTGPVLGTDLPPVDQVTDADHTAADLIALIEADGGDTPAPETLLIALAYDFARAAHADLTLAHNGLSAALQDAAELNLVGQFAPSVADPVLLCLHHVAALNNQGLREQAAIAVEQVLAALDATQTLARTALTEVATKQDRLCNAPARAAKRLLTQLRGAPHPGGLFRAIHDAWEGWFDRGADRGLTFDLTVALHLARANLERAKGIKHTQALIDLGLTQFRLGEVEGSAPRLTQAVATFRAFLAEHPRKSDPDIWAVAQVNLGVALAALARLDPAPPHIQAAIAAFRAALQVQTPAHAPQDWAATSDHLTKATTLLADRQE